MVAQFTFIQSRNIEPLSCPARNVFVCNVRQIILSTYFLITSSYLPTFLYLKNKLFPQTTILNAKKKIVFLAVLKMYK